MNRHLPDADFIERLNLPPVAPPNPVEPMAAADAVVLRDKRDFEGWQASERG